MKDTQATPATVRTIDEALATVYQSYGFMIFNVHIVPENTDHVSFSINFYTEPNMEFFAAALKDSLLSLTELRTWQYECVVNFAKLRG